MPRVEPRVRVGACWVWADPETQRVSPPMWERRNKTVPALATEASARPAGVKHPPPGGRALAGGFGPPAQTRKGFNMTSAMASVIVAISGKKHDAPSSFRPRQACARPCGAGGPGNAPRFPAHVGTAQQDRSSPCNRGQRPPGGCEAPAPRRAGAGRWLRATGPNAERFQHDLGDGLGHRRHIGQETRCAFLVPAPASLSEAMWRGRTRKRTAFPRPCGSSPTRPLRPATERPAPADGGAGGSAGGI